MNSAAGPAIIAVLALSVFCHEVPPELGKVTMPRFRHFAMSLLLLLLLFALPLSSGFAEDQGSNQGGAIDYNRQIRHILADKCLACHGFDAAERKANLRLHVRDSAIGKAESGEIAIVPGQPEKSELISRINSTDENLRMPPPETKKKLTDEEKALLKQWIAGGALKDSGASGEAAKKPTVSLSVAAGAAKPSGPSAG